MKVIFRQLPLDLVQTSMYMEMLKKKVALCNIAKIEKSQIFVLFENEASYEDLFCPQVF